MAVDICQLSVASCQLIFVSCQLRVASCQLIFVSCQLRVASCQLIFVSCELRVDICPVASCELRADPFFCWGSPARARLTVDMFSFRVRHLSFLSDA